MDEAATKLQQHLSSTMPCAVKVNIYPDYAAVVEALNSQRLDAAYLGPLTYVIANHRSGASAIVTEQVAGSPYYHSLIIARKDATFPSLDEVLKKSGTLKLAFGSISSTSGYLIPSQALIEKGVFTDEHNHKFASVQFADSHDVTIQLVQQKRVDLGAVDGAIFNELIQKGTIKQDDFAILWTSEPIYQYPWVVRSGLSKELSDALKKSMLAVTDPKILTVFGGAEKFIEVDDSRYESIRKIAKSRGLLEKK